MKDKHKLSDSIETNRKIISNQMRIQTENNLETLLTK